MDISLIFLFFSVALLCFGFEILIQITRIPITHTEIKNETVFFPDWKVKWMPRNESVVIVDVVLILNEIEMLEIRIKEMREFVDLFLVIESPQTFTGHDRDMLFSLEKWNKYSDILRFYTCEYPSELDASKGVWPREWYTRDTCMRDAVRGYLTEHELETGYVMVGDVDEIPDSRILKTIKKYNIEKNEEPKRWINFQMNRYHFNFHCRSTNMATWGGTVLLPIKDAFEMGFEQVRRKRTEWNLVIQGGWHFSNFGFDNPARLIEKYDSFSEQQIQDYIDHSYEWEFWSRLANTGGDEATNTKCKEENNTVLPKLVIEQRRSTFKPFLNEVQLNFIFSPN